MADEEGEATEEEMEQLGEMELPPPSSAVEETEEEEVKEKDEGLEEDLNITDSQVMIQLKEAEEEAAALRKEIAALKAEIDDYQCRSVLTEEDEEHLQEIQLTLMEKIALLDELTKRIAKLMEIAGKQQKSEDTTILSEEEEEGFPDDLLPKVVICSSWDDMMPKVVVCMDMKKPGAAKKKGEEDRDENGLTPEQREALEQERRCMAEERNRLQYQIACMEGEMRVMMRENDMLSRKVAQLKQEIENQPPFEFEMSVSATNPPGCGAPKPGNMDMGFGVMGPTPNGPPYTLGAALSPGAEVQGRLNIAPPPPQLPPGLFSSPAPQNNGPQAGQQVTERQPGQLPCGGINGVPGKCGPCPKLQPQEPPAPNPNDWSMMLPPYGKKCRKDFNAAQAQSGNGCGGNCGNCPSCGGGGGTNCGNGMNGTGMAGNGMNGNGMNGNGMPAGFTQNLLPPGLLKQPPMDVNFKVNVQPPAGPCDKRGSMSADARSNKIAQQLQEIEMELRRMQRDLCKAKKDKETLKAQQATLNCAKNYIM